jgi:uncharacterized integral membrane protein
MGLLWAQWRNAEYPILVNSEAIFILLYLIFWTINQDHAQWNLVLLPFSISTYIYRV